MARNIIIGIIVLIFIILVSAVVQTALQPRPFFWNPTYYNIDKQPYGAYILFSQLKDFFPGKKVKRLSEKDLQPYVDLFRAEDLNNLNNSYNYEDRSQEDDSYYTDEEENYDEDEEYSDDFTLDLVTDSTDNADTVFHMSYVEFVDSDTFNFFFLNHYFSPEKIEFKSLLQHIYLGNHALICAFDAEKAYLDYLDIELTHLNLKNEDSTQNAYTLKYKDQDFVELKPFGFYSYFNSYPEKADVLIKNKYGQVVAISLPVGKGELIFFSLPIALANYNILKKDRTIASNLLTKLPLENTYWAQNFYGNYAYSYPEKRSILVFIHSQESLTWAFYTLLFALLIYFLFQIKRRQRVIPVINPPENTSVKFLETLSNLYLAKRDYKDMLSKKMNYFLMQVRDRFNLDTHQIDEEFMKRLAQKSNVKLGVVKLLFYRYDESMKQSAISGDDFLLVTKLFQDFKHLENG